MRGREALQPVDPNTLKDAEILALSSLIELDVSSDFASAFPVGTPARVLMDQGEGLEEVVIDYPLGDVANPMSWDQIADKFKNIGRQSLSRQRQEHIISAISGLATAGFAPLFNALSASEPFNLQ